MLLMAGNLNHSNCTALSPEDNDFFFFLILNDIKCSDNPHIFNFSAAVVAVNLRLSYATPQLILLDKTNRS